MSTPIRPDVAVDDATDASAIDDRSAIDASNDRSVVMLDGAAQDSAPDASTTSADADAARDAVVDVATDVAADVATDAASARCGDAATCGVGQFCSGGACVQEATLHGGAEHMCLRVRDSYTCWGMSSNGATGNPVDVRVATPPAAHGAGASGAVFAMANYTYSTEFIFGADRAVGFLGARHAFGDNSNASGNRGPELVRIANTEGMLELANPGPGGVRCGITMDHRVRCWGCNRNGALGVGDMIATDCAASPSAPNAVTLPLTNVAQVAIARSFEHDAFRSGTVCARFESGAVRCWGINDVGQRGIGTTSLVNDLSPTAATAPDIAGHTFSWITSAESSFCGVAEGGTVYCWGEGSAYRGFGFEGAVPTPTTITNPATMAPLTNMRVVQCGVFNCCAIERGTNELFCWGNAGRQRSAPSHRPQRSAHAVHRADEDPTARNRAGNDRRRRHRRLDLRDREGRSHARAPTGRVLGRKRKQPVRRDREPRRGLHGGERERARILVVRFTHRSRRAVMEP